MQILHDICTTLCNARRILFLVSNSSCHAPTFVRTRENPANAFLDVYSIQIHLLNTSVAGTLELLRIPSFCVMLTRCCVHLVNRTLYAVHTNVSSRWCTYIPSCNIALLCLFRLIHYPQQYSSSPNNVITLHMEQHIYIWIVFGFTLKTTPHQLTLINTIIFVWLLSRTRHSDRHSDYIYQLHIFDGTNTFPMRVFKHPRYWECALVTLHTHEILQLQFHDLAPQESTDA